MRASSSYIFFIFHIDFNTIIILQKKKHRKTKEMSKEEENIPKIRRNSGQIKFNNEIQLVNYKSDVEISDISTKQHLKISISSQNVPFIKINSEQENENNEHEGQDEDIISAIDTTEDTDDFDLDDDSSQGNGQF
jgi:hypothetical protein